MVTIQIPVSTFSRKIILAKYQEPVKLSPSKLLHQQLSIVMERPYTNITRLRGMLNDTLAFEVENKKAPLLLKRGWQIGNHLHSYHVEFMLNHIQAKTMCGIPALTAMKAFYDLFEIDEDDFQMDSAYKRWQRFLEEEKHLSFFDKKMPKKKDTNCQNTASLLKVDLPYTV
ncbi:MAG: hypothetical protein ABI002_07335, partial [Saprospiraceae bacterium]